ncbi:hypothetical protein AK828_03135 [Cutibacterium acnes]|nr:hypothetical protein AK827_09835 [Cutibacterium acnes]KPG67180.1 hypothetical protein AK828_03135 [Cutibacterium acnes]
MTAPNSIATSAPSRSGRLPPWMLPPGTPLTSSSPPNRRTPTQCGCWGDLPWCTWPRDGLRRGLMTAAISPTSLKPSASTPCPQATFQTAPWCGWACLPASTSSTNC